jgi:hypothetical protein
VVVSTILVKADLTVLGARLQALVMGTGQLTIGGLYGLAPEELIRRPLTPGQVSAVVWIESRGPIWVMLFAVTGVWLLGAAWLAHGFVRAHIAAAGVWAFYSGCILYSAVLTEPPVPIIAGTTAGFVAVLNIVIARADAERGLR